MTFNTVVVMNEENDKRYVVLNLVINGWPSIPRTSGDRQRNGRNVLNLVINGWPSILNICYESGDFLADVLNLVINGWPSIHYDGIHNFFYKQF